MYNNFNQNFQQSYQTQPQIQFFVVGSKQEAQNIQVQFNITYFIVNNVDKEVYTKQLNRDGLIDFEVYKNEKLINQNKKDNELLEEIKNKLDKIEKSVCLDNIDKENNNE